MSLEGRKEVFNLRQNLRTETLWSMDCQWNAFTLPYQERLQKGGSYKIAETIPNELVYISGCLSYMLGSGHS